MRVQIYVEDESNTLGGGRSEQIVSLEGYIGDEHVRNIVDAIRDAYTSSNVMIRVREVVERCSDIHKSGGVGLVNWPHENGWLKGGE